MQRVLNIKILITSGPTRVPLDSVRFLTNRSAGRFGTLLADAALKKGFQVTFVCGVGSQTPKSHRSLRLISVETNRDVAKVLKKELMRGRYAAVIHAMAVLDFQPAHFKNIKTKTKRGVWRLKLVPTPKIIDQIKKWAPKTLLVGFKLETGVSQNMLLQEARRLLKKSKADFILANQLSEGKDSSHAGWLLDDKGRVVGKAKGKAKLARLILSYVTPAPYRSTGQAPAGVQSSGFRLSPE
ncbi:MAG: phosphopantothenoylcysteine decarboxylase [Deltaproteobacteria bacterium]|nr:phosphopantothenoylcysteine decarboxylase [Deltaproteobacteria bacterium]